MLLLPIEDIVFGYIGNSILPPPTEMNPSQIYDTFTSTLEIDLKHSKNKFSSLEQKFCKETLKAIKEFDATLSKHEKGTKQSKAPSTPDKFYLNAIETLLEQIEKYKPLILNNASSSSSTLFPTSSSFITICNNAISTLPQNIRDSAMTHLKENALELRR